MRMQVLVLAHVASELEVAGLRVEGGLHLWAFKLRWDGDAGSRRREATAHGLLNETMLTLLRMARMLLSLRLHNDIVPLLTVR